MEVLVAAVFAWVVLIPATLVGAAWLRVQSASRRTPRAQVIDLASHRAYAARAADR